MRVVAFKEDMAPQMILLMGLPAAGKSTFIKAQLTKYYQHRMPHASGFKVLNSDVQLRRLQYERAMKDFAMLKQAADTPGKYELVRDLLTYTSNEGKEVPFDLPLEELQQIVKPDDFWRRMFRSYYVTYFGERAAAKKTTDELADKKISGGDVVIFDSTGVNTARMLKYFKQGKAMGYTTSVVYLEIKPEYAVARDTFRGATEGRSVGEHVIRSYVPKIASAHKTYLAEKDLVDRFLHFKWTGQENPKSGVFKLAKDVKNYPRKQQKQKLAARRLSMASRMTGKQQAEVVAALLKAGRRDLAKQMVVARVGHHHKVGKDYYADTAFMNSIPSDFGTMKHMGFGEFTLHTKDGAEIEFDRMRGKDFDGQSGRSHKLYDNKGGKGVAALIKLMEQKKASELV